ncbi:MAG: diacylglycerol kinase family protein [bacterium]
MKIAIITNESSGTISTEEKEKLIKDAFKDINVQFELFILKNSEMQKKVKELIQSNVDVIAAGGGDGTVSLIAELLSGSDKTLGVLPLGTLNHFAKDLGIPQDLKKAVEVLSKGNIKKIDIAEVNGKRFINNSSIGLYPHIVKKRDKDQKIKNRSKWVAMFFAAIETLKSFSKYNVTIITEGNSTNISTYFVLVGNNKYKMEFFNPGIRDRLDEGLLTLSISKSQTRWGMVRLSFKAIFNALQNENDFEMYFVEEVTLKTSKKNLVISMDGEVVNVTSPLNYKILPKQLSVIVP